MVAICRNGPWRTRLLSRSYAVMMSYCSRPSCGETPPHAKSCARNRQATLNIYIFASMLPIHVVTLMDLDESEELALRFQRRLYTCCNSCCWRFIWTFWLLRPPQALSPGLRKHLPCPSVARTSGEGAACSSRDMAHMGTSNNGAH